MSTATMPVWFFSPRILCNTYKLIFLISCLYCLFALFFSFTKKPRRSGPAVCWYVELCYDPLGACDKRSSVWKSVTYGSWHEGWWSHLSLRVMRIKILLVLMSMLRQSVCHKNLGHDHAQYKVCFKFSPLCLLDTWYYHLSNNGELHFDNQD